MAHYLDFEGAMKTHVLKVLIWGFGECWRFPTGVWHLDLDLDMVIGLCYSLLDLAWLELGFYLLQL